MTRLASLLAALAVMLALHLADDRSAVEAFSGPPTGLWWLNTFLNGSQFGEWPTHGLGYLVGRGPCETYAKGVARCSLDLSTLPASVKAIGAALPYPFNNNVTLGSAFPTGQLVISFAQIQNTELGSVYVTGEQEDTSSRKLMISINGFKTDAMFDLKLTNIYVPVIGFPLGNIDTTVRLDKIAQTTGTQIRLNATLASIQKPPAFPSTSPVPLSSNIVNTITFPNNECNMSFDLGVTLTRFETDLPFTGGKQAFVTSIFNTVLQPFLGSALCFFAKQLAVTPAGGSGILQVEMDKFYNAVGNASTLPAPVLATEESKFVANDLTPAQDAAAFKLGKSIIVKGLDQTINPWLGGTGNPVINEMVNLLTSPTNGTKTFTHLENLGLSLNLTMDALWVDITLRNLTVSGMNTFNNLAILTNPSSLNYTLYHEIGLSQVGISAVVDVILRDSLNPLSWQPNPRSKQFGMRVTYSALVHGLALRVATLIVNNPALLNTLSLGQILGKSTGGTTFGAQAIAAAHCTAVAMYGFALPSLNMSIASLDTPAPNFAMVDYNPVSGAVGLTDSGLNTLVNTATVEVLTILEGTIARLDGVSQRFIRPLVNNLTASLFSSSGATSNCPAYSPVAPAKIYPNLVTSRIFSSISALVRNVIGGSVVGTHAANVNAFLEQAVVFLINTLDLDAVEEAPGNWTFNVNASLGAGSNFLSGPGTTAIATTVFKLGGLNSINKLLLEGNGNPNSFDLAFAMGTATKPLVITIGQDWRVDYAVGNDISEQFSFKIVVTGISLGMHFDTRYNLDEFYQLKLNQLTNLDCALAPLDSAAVAGNLSVSSVKIVTQRVSTNNAVNALNSAITKLVLESSKNTDIAYIINVVMKSGINFVVDKINNFDTSITAANCEQQTQPVSTILKRLLKAALTTTKSTSQIFIDYFGPQPAPESYAASEARVDEPANSNSLNFLTSKLANVVPNAVASFTPSGLRNLLVRFGNASGDPVSDVLVLDNPSSPTTAVNLDVEFSNYAFMDRLNTNPANPGGWDLSFLVTNATFWLNRLVLTNLTNLDVTSLKILKPVSKFITHTYISIPGATTFFFSFSVDFPAKFLNTTAPKFTETVNVSLTLTDLVIDIELLAGINLDLAKLLSVGHFLAMNEDGSFKLYPAMLQCLFATFYDEGLFFPRLLIDATLSPIVISTTNYIISPGAEDFVNAALNVFVDLYSHNLPDVTQGAVRHLINNYLLLPAVNEDFYCADPPPPDLLPGREYLDFLNSSTVNFVRDLTHKWLAGDDGQYRVFNQIISSLLDSKIFWEGENRPGFEQLGIVFKRNILGELNGDVGHLALTGAGTFGDLTVFSPLTNASFTNSIRLLGPMEVSFQIRYNMTELFVDEPAGGNVDQLQIDLTLKNLSVAFDVYLVLLLPKLLTVRASSFTSLSQIPCVLTAVEHVGLSNFQLDLGGLGAVLSCSGTCTSPVFKPLQGGGTLKTSADGGSVTKLLPKIIEFGVNYLNGASFLKKTNNAVSNSVTNCAASLNLTTIVGILNSDPDPELNIALIFALALVGAATAIFALIPLLIPRHYQIKDRLIADNLRIANQLTGGNPQAVAKYMAKREREMISLAYHPAIGRFWKVFVPFVALLNILMLSLSFTLFLSFSVDVTITLLGNKTKKITAVPWTISSTLNDFWNSGAWPLSLLVVGASCAWPVAKNALLLLIWCAPSTLLTHEKRMYYLLNLDVLGKWSVLDAYIIVLLVGALNFYLQLSEASLLSVLPIPAEFLIIAVTITPGIGIVLLVLAALFSLAINHCIIWLTLGARWSDARLFKQMDGEQDDVLSPKAEIRLVLADYVFSTSTPDGQRDRYGPRAKNTAIALCASGMLFTLIGDLLPFFSTIYDGLVGLAIGFFVDGGRIRTFSLIGIGTKLADASDGTAGSMLLMLLFQIIYFVTILVAPLMHLGLFLFLWIRPLSLKDARTLLFAAKVAAYWSCVEVFSVAIVATTVEIKVVTYFLVDFITGGSCGAAKPLLKDLLGTKNGWCLDPTARLEYGFFLALLACFYQIGVGVVMLRLCQLAIRDREDVLENRPHHPWGELEYRIMDYFLVHGAAHHKPTNMVPATKKFQLALENPCGTFGIPDCRKVCTCLDGIQDVTLTSAGNAHGGARVANSNAPSTTKTSKWNVATPASSQKWQAQYNPSQQFSMGGGLQGSRAPSQQSSYAMPTPSQQHMMQGYNPAMDSVNPVFARESAQGKTNTNRFSVDV